MVFGQAPRDFEKGLLEDIRGINDFTYLGGVYPANIIIRGIDPALKPRIQAQAHHGP
jgi:hypothetical protein